MKTARRPARKPAKPRKRESRTCGIYRIRNKKTGRRYFGQSSWIEHRWRDHVQELNSGQHCNYRLREDWRKYGARAFEFRVVERCLESQLDLREAIWISTTAEDEYNIMRPSIEQVRRRQSEGGVDWLLWAIGLLVLALICYSA